MAARHLTLHFPFSLPEAHPPPVVDHDQLRQPPNLLPLPASLSLSNPRSFSLLKLMVLLRSTMATRMLSHAHKQGSFRGHRNGEARLPSCPIVAVGNDGSRVGRSWLLGEPRCSLTNYDGQVGCQQVPLGLLVPMVSSVCDKSAWIIDKFFRAKAANFASWFEPNGALFWGNDLKSILVEKNAF